MISAIFAFGLFLAIAGALLGMTACAFDYSPTLDRLSMKIAIGGLWITLLSGSVLVFGKLL